MGKREGLEIQVFRRAWSVIALGMSIWSHLSSAAALTLPQALQIALEKSPTLQAVLGTESVRELEKKTAFWRFFPSLDLSMTGGLQNNFPISTSTSSVSLITTNPSAPWYSTFTLGLTETLYDNGVSLTQFDVAGLRHELSRLEARRARDGLALDLSSEFYNYSQAVVMLEVRKLQYATVEKQFQSLSAQYRQGFKTKSDFLRIRAQLQRAEIERNSAEGAVRLSEAGLRRILGLSPSESDVRFEPVGVPGKDLALPEVAPALRTTFAYEIRRIQNEINDRDITLARRRWWPQLSAAAGINYTLQNFINSGNPLFQGQQLSWSALLSLQFNFWDWGTRSRDIEIARKNRDIAEARLNDEVLAVDTQIVQLMTDIARVKKGAALARELLASEEESYTHLESQYRAGKIAYLDLITGLNTLLDARTQFYAASFEMLQRLAKYRYYEGKLYETLTQN